MHRPSPSSTPPVATACRYPRRFCRPALMAFLALPILLFAVASLWPSAPARAADQRTTLFLPLKINAEAAADLAAASDLALSATLLDQGTEYEKFRWLSRAEAETALDYQGAWPPSLAAVQPLLAQLEKKGVAVDYIAAGSLTVLGRQISLDIRIIDRRVPELPTYYYQGATLTGESIGSAELAAPLAGLVAEIRAYTGRDFQIASITPQGNERIDAGAILRQIKSRAGDRYDPERLGEDMKNVFKMGYFDDVRVEAVDSDQGKVVTFVVVEKPVISQVDITGAKELKEETVREVVTVMPNTILNPGRVREASEAIRALYKSKGFYNTMVEAKFNYPEPDRVRVQFVIDEGAKVYIKEIGFAGNNAFKDRELAKVIETSEKGFFSWLTESGVLKRDILEQDADRITAFYHNHGFIEAQVGTPEVRQEDAWLYLTFNIAEGERYGVGRVVLTGDLIAGQQVLRDLLKINAEQFLSRKTLREDILRLTDYYAEHGYAFAEALPTMTKDEAAKKVDIVIDLRKGNLVHINRIVITGNTRTRDKVIRREMAVKEGGIFNSKGLRDSNRRLMRLDFFEEVNITPEPTPDRDRMDVVVAVTEKPTGSFSIGAGYSSVENLLVMGEISQNNFLGKGQRLALQANLSSRTSRYNLSFTEPHLADSKLLVGMDFYDWQREYDDWTKDSRGGALRFGYPLWADWNAGFSYGYDHTDLDDVDLTKPVSRAILQSLDLKVTSFVKLSVGRDTRNHPYDVSSGSQHLVSVKYAGGPLGGDSAFTKLEGSTGWYFPAFFGTTFHLRLTAGQVFENETGRLPIYENFYLGGISTIRGFDPGQISPLDPVTGERIGGDRMWYVNEELLFPLVKEAGLKGVIFFDAGNVYEDTWAFERIKRSVGTGIRWLSPMGPLRLEWGYNLDPVGDEENSVWDFSIGGAF